MKNTKAEIAHREELQLRDPNNWKIQNNIHYKTVQHTFPQKLLVHH